MANHTIMFPRRNSDAARLTSTHRNRGLEVVGPSPVEPKVPMDTLAHARSIVAQVERELQQHAARARKLVTLPRAKPSIQIVHDTPLVVARRLFYTFFGRIAS